MISPDLTGLPVGVALHDHQAVVRGDVLDQDTGMPGGGRVRRGQAGRPGGHGLLPGTVIYSDSSADSAGPQLLYQAIGGTNLRAYTDTDAVGHAATGN